MSSTLSESIPVWATIAIIALVILLYCIYGVRYFFFGGRRFCICCLFFIIWLKKEKKAKVKNPESEETEQHEYVTTEPRESTPIPQLYTVPVGQHQVGYNQHSYFEQEQYYPEQNYGRPNSFQQNYPEQSYGPPNIFQEDYRTRSHGQPDSLHQNLPGKLYELHNSFQKEYPIQTYEPLNTSQQNNPTRNNSRQNFSSPFISQQIAHHNKSNLATNPKHHDKHQMSLYAQKSPETPSYSNGRGELRFSKPKENVPALAWTVQTQPAKPITKANSNEPTPDYE